MSLFFHKAEGLGTLQLHQPGMRRAVLEVHRHRLKLIFYTITAEPAPFQSVAVLKMVW
jgi:hypothetical protein